MDYICSVEADKFFYPPTPLLLGLLLEYYYQLKFSILHWFPSKITSQESLLLLLNNVSPITSYADNYSDLKPN